MITKGYVAMNTDIQRCVAQGESALAQVHRGLGRNAERISH